MGEGAVVENVIARTRTAKEGTMARKFIDCREYPSETNCTIAISADTEDEVVEAATQHAVSVHHHADSPELRQMMRSAVQEGTPA
jgi:predicted small metal-binding protein